MKRRDVIGLLTTVPFLVLTGCGEMFPKRFRFKMTVEVETPEGLKTGSSVMEMSASLASFKLPESHAVNLGVNAEAVAVELPGGQTLFALVDNLEYGAVATFDSSNPREEKLVQLFEMLAQSLGQSAEMLPPYFPRFVRFRDIRDPKTVDLVDPNDLTKSFGPGVKLKRVVLTVVDEPVTVGIENRLRWLPQYRGKMLDGSRFNDKATLVNGLGFGSFSRKLVK